MDFLLNKFFGLSLILDDKMWAYVILAISFTNVRPLVVWVFVLPRLNKNVELIFK